MIPSVSLEFQRGQLSVLLGPSGCGKTTLLRMIAGLDHPDTGQIYFDGRPLTDVPAAKRPVSMVFQNYALFPHLTVAENITFGLRMAGVARAEQHARLDRVAQIMGLSPLLTRKPRQLSGGQQQRVALARAIISDRPICLMDEPLSNLDAKLRLELRDEIRAVQQSLGLTMVYVTHDQTEAMALADQVIILTDGRVRQVGTPRDIYDQPADLFCARFVGQLPMNIVDGAAMSSLVGDLPSQTWIGIRPEALVLDQHGHHAVIDKVEYLGSDHLLHLRIGTMQLLARAGALSGQFVPGGRCQVSIPDGAIHVFDQRTEQRILHISPQTKGRGMRQ